MKREISVIERSEKFNEQYMEACGNMSCVIMSKNQKGSIALETKSYTSFLIEWIAGNG